MTSNTGETSKPTTFAFDVYGTLIDTDGVVRKLESLVGHRAKLFSRLWREKQLEYSFRRGLMQDYADFSVCIRDALDYTSWSLGFDLSPDQRKTLQDAYRNLPAFDDAKQGLETLQAQGHRLFAFSNGSAEAIERLLEQARIRKHFVDIISVEEIRSFKPNPGVYAHFLRRSGARGNEAWLISGNSFDVIGAISAGMRAAWIKRSEAAIFDPWGIDPDATVPDLRTLSERFA